MYKFEVNALEVYSVAKTLVSPPCKGNSFVVMLKETYTQAYVNQNNSLSVSKGGRDLIHVWKIIINM